MHSTECRDAWAVIQSNRFIWGGKRTRVYVDNDWQEQYVYDVCVMHMYEEGLESNNTQRCLNLGPRLLAPFPPIYIPACATELFHHLTHPVFPISTVSYSPASSKVFSMTSNPAYIEITDNFSKTPNGRAKF